MKKLNAKGFTLIELLAVITIMGVLMLVAIPTVSRTIDNTRKDTFLDTAKQYVNGVKTMWVSESLECQTTTGATEYTGVAALPAGIYYVRIDSSKTSGIGSGTEYPIILESGGKSSWSNRNVKGYVRVDVTGNSDGIVTQKYYIRLTDGVHGVVDFKTTQYNDLKRGNVLTAAADAVGVAGAGATLEAIDTPNSAVAGAAFKDASPRFCKEV